ncbi:hypothetical protein PFISCL1PPCAC_6787, partial [Pristionchus fissidentatus]
IPISMTWCGRLATLLFLSLSLHFSIISANFECYNGVQTENKTSGVCTGGMCQLTVQYKGIKLNYIGSITGECIPTGETGCWKYQGDHKAICHCKADKCNSKANQDRAIKNALNLAGHTRLGTVTSLAPLIVAIYYYSWH